MIIKNIGPIKELNIMLNQETIFFGDNNSGKTYASYAIYGILKYIQNMKINLIEEGEIQKFINQSGNLILNKDELKKNFSSLIQDSVSKNLKKILAETFNISESNFNDSSVMFSAYEISDFLKNNNYGNDRKTVQMTTRSFMDDIFVTVNVEYDEESITFDLEEVSQISLSEFESVDTGVEKLDSKYHQEIFRMTSRMIEKIVNERLFKIPNLLYIPAERNGINVFRNELVRKRSNDYDISNVNDRVGKFVEKSVLYPSPISDYISYLNDMESTKRHSREPDEAAVWRYFLENIMKGKFEVSDDGKDIFYRELYSKKGSKNFKYRTQRVPFHVASSSTKTLYGLDFYIENLMECRDVLIIDEPEMNLDPQSQIRMGETLSLLAQNGVKVIISTHSDNLIKSTTNYLLRGQLMELTNGYRNVLRDEDVSCYYFKREKILPIKSLIKEDFISNFDDPSRILESNYFELLDEIELLENDNSDGLKDE